MADFTGKSKEELIDIIDDLESQIKNRKLGLVWDHEETEEDIVVQCRDKFPVLTEVPEKAISSSKPMYNLLIEGDNFPSLSALIASGLLVDVIYIDPPYNSGTSFRYNNDIVDEKDTYKHSKWLTFMEKRLQLAYELLSEDGVLFISIDDNEVCHLKLLCDQIFGAPNFVGALPRVTKKSGKQHSESICKNHDYVLVYARNMSFAKFCGIQQDDPSYSYSDEYVATRGKYKENQTLDYDSLYYNPGMDFGITVDGVTYYPGGDYQKHLDRLNGKHNNMDWVWRWSKAKFDFGYANGFVDIKTGGDRPRIYTKTYANATISKDTNGKYYVDIKPRETNMSSLELVGNEYSNDNGTKDLDRIIGKNIFEYSKPVELIKQLLRIVDNKDAVVLDFFAGSGTTGQAVLELNEEDGGGRKFILCTNNENNICEDVTYKRISRVIQGYEFTGKDEVVLYSHKIRSSELEKPLDFTATVLQIELSNKGKYDEIKPVIEDSTFKIIGYRNLKGNVPGIPSNLRFFKTDFVNQSKNRDQLKYDVSQACCGLLCIKQNTFDLVKKTEKYSIYTNKAEGHTTCIFTDVFDSDSVAPFLKELKELPGEKNVFILSFNDAVPVALFAGIDNLSLEPIPAKIVDIYQRLERELC